MSLSASVSIDSTGAASIAVNGVNAASPGLPTLFGDLAKVAGELEAAAPSSGPPPSPPITPPPTGPQPAARR